MNPITLIRAMYVAGFISSTLRTSLENGTLRKWRGVGHKGYDILCKSMDVKPLPVEVPIAQQIEKLKRKLKRARCDVKRAENKIAQLSKL